jgi:hypothetical protein
MSGMRRRQTGTAARNTRAKRQLFAALAAALVVALMSIARTGAALIGHTAALNTICDEQWQGTTGESITESRRKKLELLRAGVRPHGDDRGRHTSPPLFDALLRVLDSQNAWCAINDTSDRRFFKTPGGISPRSAQIQLNAQTPGGYVYFEAPGMTGSFRDNFLVQPSSAFASANLDVLEGNVGRWKLRLNLATASATNVMIKAKRPLSLNYAVIEASVLNGCALDGGQTQIATECGFGQTTWNEAGTLSGYRILPGESSSKIAVKSGVAIFIFNAELPAGGVRTGDTGVITGKLKAKLIDNALIGLAATAIKGKCLAW